MIVGPTKALFMDEISTGLDSSTTFSIVNSLRQSAKILQYTILVSLLQPAPETFNLFDDIILLSEGQVVYHGPRDQVLAFFESCGFRCPDRKGIADFLQEVKIFSLRASIHYYTWQIWPKHNTHVFSHILCSMMCLHLQGNPDIHTIYFVCFNSNNYWAVYEMKLSAGNIA